MADILSINATLAIPLFLKREDDQHLTHVLLHQLDAGWPPGPQLRRYEIDHGDPVLMQLPGKLEIEIGKIDQNGSLRFAPVDLPQQSAIARIDSRQMSYHLR